MFDDAAAIALRDSWIARINAHLPAGEKIDEADLSPVATEDMPL